MKTTDQTRFFIKAVYLKANGLHRRTEIELATVVAEMQQVTEMTNDEIQTEVGLLQMACAYILDKEQFDKAAQEEAADYNSMYR